MEGGGRMSGLSSRQDEGTFEDALRRLNALELKLTEQVKIDIRDLKQTWVLPKVDRVTRNAYKLFQVREQLKLSKEYFVEEEHILSKFNLVKESLRNTMDEEDFEATKETCMFLGLKLKDIRNKQFKCYAENKDLEVAVNAEIMSLKFEDRDFKELDIEHVRASTPVRQMSPTPLERHRSRSKEPSPFRMPALRIGGGSVTPGSMTFSRPGSTGSNYQGLENSEDLRRFKESFEAKRGPYDDDASEDGQPSFLFTKPGLLKSDSDQNVLPSEGRSDLLTIDRPGSALSDMSINIQDDYDGSRPGSRQSNVGDVVSTGKFQTAYYAPGADSANVGDNEEFIADIKKKFQANDSVESDKQPDVGHEDASNVEVVRGNEIGFESMEDAMTFDKSRGDTMGIDNKYQVADEQDRSASLAQQETSVDASESKNKTDKDKTRTKSTDRSSKHELENNRMEGTSKDDSKRASDETTSSQRKEAEEEEKKKMEGKGVSKRTKSTERKKAEEADKISKESDKNTEGALSMETTKPDEESNQLAKESDKNKQDTTSTKRKTSLEKKKADESEKQAKEADKKTEGGAAKKPWTRKKPADKADIEKDKQEKKPAAMDGTDKKPEATKKKPWTKPKPADKADNKNNDNKAEKFGNKVGDKRTSSLSRKATVETENDQVNDSEMPRKPSIEAKSTKESTFNDPSLEKDKGSSDDILENLVANAEAVAPKTTINKESEVVKKREASKDRKKNAEVDSLIETKTEAAVHDASDDTFEKETASKISGKTNDNTNIPSDKNVSDCKIVQMENYEQSAKIFEEEKPVTKPNRPSTRSVSGERTKENRNKSSERKVESSNVGKKEEDILSRKSVEKEDVLQRKSSLKKTEEKPIEKRKASSERKKSDPDMNESLETRKKSTERKAKERSIERRTLSSERKEAEESKKRKPSSERKQKDFSKERISSKERKEKESEVPQEKRKTSFDRSNEKELKVARKTSGERKKDRSMSSDGKAINEGAGKRKTSSERTKSIGSKTQMDSQEKENSPLEETVKPAAKKRKSRADFKDNKKSCNDDKTEDSVQVIEKEAAVFRSKSADKKHQQDVVDQSSIEDNYQPNQEILSSIADTSLEAGMSKMADRFAPRKTDEEMMMTSEDSYDEPADYYPSDNQEIDEDELMLVLGNDQEINEHLSSDSMEVDDVTEMRRGLEENLAWQRFNSDLSEMEQFKHFSKDSTPDSECIPMTEEIRGTGFSQLDEFERKLAEMESELKQEEEMGLSMQTEDMYREEEHLRDDFGQANQSAPPYDTYHGQNDDDLYAVCIPKSQRKNFTHDGFVINQDSEINTVDHSNLQADEEINELDQTEMITSPPAKGEILARSKKVSFAESDEKFEIEREAQVKTLGMKLFSFGPPKAMRSITTGEIIDNSERKDAMASEPAAADAEPETPIEKNSAAMEFISAMTGGLLGSKSPDSRRKAESGMSAFRGLLRKKGSRSGSRTSSLDRSSQQGSDIDTDGRTSSRGSNYDDDDDNRSTRSDSSFAQRLGLKRKKKPKVVQPTDFDELFARGMALSATLESSSPATTTTNKDQLSKKNEASGYQEDILKGSAGQSRYDEHGTRFTPFEVYSHDDAFKKSQKEEGIGYAEKVMSYLDDQAHAPKMNVELMGMPEQGVIEAKPRHSKQEKSLPSAPTQNQAMSDKRKRSREYAKPEDIHLSPLPKRDLFTGQELPPSPQSAMLQNIADFVAQNEVDSQYSQPVWPATPSKENMPSLKEFRTNMQIPRVEVTDFPSQSSQQQQDLGSASNNQQNKNEPDMASNEIQELPHQLMPDKLMENEEFFEKLRTGLRNISLPPEDNESGANFQRYSHHLGRAEFGSLRRVESNSSAHSRDPSGDRKRTSSVTGRDLSGDRLPGRSDSSLRVAKSASGDKVNVGFLQQTNREHYYDKVDKSKRGSSRQTSEYGSSARLSDFSDPLPDLESQTFDDCASDFEIANVGGREDHSEASSTRRRILKTQSLDVEAYNHEQNANPNLDALTKRENVLRDISNHKAQIREAKAWIQNGLMGAVGFCVVVYLQSLEMITTGQ